MSFVRDGMGTRLAALEAARETMQRLLPEDMCLRQQDELGFVDYAMATDGFCRTGRSRCVDGVLRPYAGGYDYQVVAAMVAACGSPEPAEVALAHDPTIVRRDYFFLADSGHSPKQQEAL